MITQHRATEIQNTIPVECEEEGGEERRRERRREREEGCDRGKKAPVTVSHLSVTVETANGDVKLPSPWEQNGLERTR